MTGNIAVTDYEWYDFLRQREGIDEVNFWKPSAHRRFLAEPFSPFLFKLKSPYNAICGFGYFAKYSALPDWLAWDCFGAGNGCVNFAAMQERIGAIRKRMNFRGSAPVEQIGCILIVNPVFFALDEWVPQPADWPPPNLISKKYDLNKGEGERVWLACLERAAKQRKDNGPLFTGIEPVAPRHGAPILIQPRLGQGTFRVAVTDAYQRSCAVTREHSLPALDAAHIRPYGAEGPHSTRNGILLGADLHRLFDQGYLTVTDDFRLEVGLRLKDDYDNGRTYYPLHGTELHLPPLRDDSSSRAFSPPLS